MNAYFASYLHYNGNDWVKPTHTYLLMPAIDFLNNCVLTVGVKLAKKIGLRYVLLMSIACAYISCFLLIIYPNYFLVIFAMGIFGIGSGLGYFPPIENCWKYYPKSNALIFGICVAGLGLSSSILTPLADFFIVNKNKEKTDGDGYYPEEVANNLKTYLYILTGIYVFLGVSAFLLAFEFKEENEQKEDANLIEDKKDEENNPNEQKIEEVKEKKNISFKEMIFLFKTKKFLMILSFCICGLCKN
jgi:Na+/melibiose symporter-like transporter